MTTPPPQPSVIPADRGARIVFVSVVVLCGIVVSFVLGNVLPIIGAVLLAGWAVMWSLINQRVVEGPKRLPHECWHCGYDRRGLSAEASCPECGHPSRS